MLSTKTSYYVRRGRLIYDKKGNCKEYKSINLAKKESHSLQLSGKGLGRGDVKLWPAKICEEGT